MTNPFRQHYRPTPVPRAALTDTIIYALVVIAVLIVWLTL